MRKYLQVNEGISGNGWRKREHVSICEALRKEFSFLKREDGSFPPMGVLVEALNKDLHSLPECEVCGNPIKIKDRLKRFCSKKCSSICLRETNSNINEHAKSILSDSNKLRELYKEYPPERIGEMLDVTGRTVINYMKRHGIPRYRNEARVPDEAKDILADKKKLVGGCSLYGVYGLASKLGISVSPIYSALDRLSVKFNRGVPEYSFDVLTNKDKLRDIYVKKGAIGAASELNVNITTVYNYMYCHNIPRDNVDFRLESSIAEFLDSLGVNYIRNDRMVLNGLELDIYIPSMGIAIEMNGIYWHSEQFRDSSYHKNKTDSCLEAGIQLFHIYEDEWYSRRTQWENKLKHVMGFANTDKVYARSCSIVEDDPNHLRGFVDNNHIQGWSSGSRAFSLYDKYGSLVAAMIFKKDSSDASSVVLNRYATSKLVVGGFSKLLKHAETLLKRDGYLKIVSFADRSLSNGEVYSKNGWVKEYVTPPDYRYVVNNRRVRKQNFRKSKLSKKFPEIYDDRLSEHEIMLKAGIYRVYDSGLIKFRKDL